MSISFQAQSGLIIIHARLEGPAGGTILRLALDTGSGRTVIGTDVLVSAGYDPSLSAKRIQMTTASGVESAPIIVIDGLKALGHELRNLSIVSHMLPLSATIDGLLGLDFFRGKELVIDFRADFITLN